jgi:hypothetical protein
MAGRHPKLWNWPLLGVGLMLLADYAPFPDPLNRVVAWVAIVVMLAYGVAGLWGMKRSETA